jgi:uncharacterized protein HemX
MSDAPKQNKSDINLEDIKDSNVNLTLEQGSKVVAETVNIYNYSAQINPIEKNESITKEKISDKRKQLIANSSNNIKNTAYGMLLAFLFSAFLLVGFFLYIGTFQQNVNVNKSNQTIQNDTINSPNNSQSNVTEQNVNVATNNVSQTTKQPASTPKTIIKEVKVPTQTKTVVQKESTKPRNKVETRKKVEKPNPNATPLDCSSTTNGC